MTRSLEDEFVGLYAGIFTDICAYHPTLREDCDRDLSRLRALASNMGPKLFTLALPAVGKLLDASLESGRLERTGTPLTRSYSRRSVIPRLFRGLWMRLFEDSGCLKQNIDSNDVFFLRTLLYAGKKFRSSCAPSATYKAVKEYYDVERSLPAPSKEWEGDGSDLHGCDVRSLSDLSRNHGDLFSKDYVLGDDDRLLLVCQTIADRVSSLLGEYIAGQAGGFRHGPGAVSDSKTGSHFKYDFLNWGPRLQHVFPASEFAFANLRRAIETDDYEYAGLAHSEPASYLYAVPKTQKGPRLIAAEPACHQWAQQSVRNYLTDAIRDTIIGKSIDFSSQGLSGALACAASFDRKSATVDLSSASDRLSCFVVERMFRRNKSLLSAFISCRTRFLINDIDKKHPKIHHLRKFASMGSALTFPVQSLCFYIACVAAGVVATQTDVKNWHQLGTSVRVYGDDLIVPVSWMPYVEQLLSLLFLKVNRSKTFVNGYFRESCGTDAYGGDIVSPGQILQFYDQARISSIQGVIDSANNLYFHGLWAAAESLLASVPKSIMKLVPLVPTGADSFGLVTASGYKFLSKKRWNKDLQRDEYAALKFIPKAPRTSRYEGFANLLQYFTEDPSQTDISAWESGDYAKPLTVVSKGWVTAS